MPLNDATVGVILGFTITGTLISTAMLAGGIYVMWRAHNEIEKAKKKAEESKQELKKFLIKFATDL